MDVQTSIYILERWGLGGLVFVVAALAIYHRKRFFPVLRSRFRNWLFHEDEYIDLTTQRIDCTIDLILSNLVIKWSACRAYVFEYFDYDERIQPIPYIVASNTYEVVNKIRGVKSEKEKLQRIPLSAIPWWSKQLAQNRQIILHDIDEIKKEDIQSYEILKAQQIQSVYCFSLLDFFGKPIGFAGIDYCVGVKTEIQDVAAYNALKMEIVKIAGLIAIKKNGTLTQLAGTL